MSKTPVDLANLRSMTEGDAEMEKELFEQFNISFQSGISSLEESMQKNNTEAWRREAHALKGIALNLGAEKLGELCKAAQEQFADSVAVKTASLNNIKIAYHDVEHFLASQN